LYKVKLIPHSTTTLVLISVNIMFSCHSIFVFYGTLQSCVAASCSVVKLYDCCM